MPYLFSKLKTDEKYRKAERELFRERYCVFWLELVCFVCWESKWRVVREKGVRVGESKSFSSDGQEKMKAGVDEIRGSQSRWRVMVCSWSPLETLFVCFFSFSWCLKDDMLKLDASCEGGGGSQCGSMCIPMIGLGSGHGWLLD